MTPPSWRHHARKIKSTSSPRMSSLMPECAYALLYTFSTIASKQARPPTRAVAWRDPSPFSCVRRHARHGLTHDLPLRESVQGTREIRERSLQRNHSGNSGVADGPDSSATSGRSDLDGGSRTATPKRSSAGFFCGSSENLPGEGVSDWPAHLSLGAG